MIVDSSVWISSLRREDNPETVRLRQALQDGQPIRMLPVILQEVLQGADSPQRFIRWATEFSSTPCIQVADPAQTAVQAAQLYARCRWQGVSLRSAADCLIAASAIELNLPLLHRDRDFTSIASIEPRLLLVQP